MIVLAWGAHLRSNCTADTWEKHHRAKNTHSVIHFLMTQPPHLEESTILMCKGETAWVEMRTGCAQRCQAATRWQAVLRWRKKKKSCQELAESQTQTEVQGQSSKPCWWRKYQIQSQDTEKEEMEHQPVCKAGIRMKAFRHHSAILHRGSTVCQALGWLLGLKTSLFPPRPKNFYTCIYR